MLEVEEKGDGGGEAVQAGRKTYRMLEGRKEGASGRGPGNGTGHPWALARAVMTAGEELEE